MSDQFPNAIILADSVNSLGDRVTTFEVTMHRFVLAEFNTHRVFSRNSASSRAIPVSKQLKMLEENGPALPLSWPTEQKGMQGGEELSPREIGQIVQLWRVSQEHSIAFARNLLELSLHKSVTNRLLEPFMRHKVVVTATAWTNFFDQRCSPLAQLEIRAVAEIMRDLYMDSTPVKLREGEWHLPYVSAEEKEQLDWPELIKLSSARCARTSFLTQNGIRDWDADYSLYERLTTAEPKHWSPLEHPCTPWSANRQSDPIGFNFDFEYHKVNVGHLPRVGNLLGFRSARTQLETILQENTYR